MCVCHVGDSDTRLLYSHFDRGGYAVEAFGALGAGALVWVVLVGVLGGYLTGVIGFGFPMVAMPLLTLVLPFKTAILVTLIPIVCLSLLAMFVSGGKLRDSVGRFWFMPFLVVAGVYIGTRFVIGIDARPLVLVLAAAILVFLNLERFGRARFDFVVRHSTAFAALFAFIAGLFEATVNVAAPVLLVFFLMVGLNPRQLVQTLNYCWVGGKVAQIATWSVVGGVTFSFWVSTLPLTVIACAAYFFGQRLRNRLPAATYLRGLRAFLWVMSGVLIVQFIRSIM